MIYIKNQYEIEMIRQAAEIWKKIRAVLSKEAKQGVSLSYLDNLANDIAINSNATMSFYRYGDFPGHICISVNDQLIHGVPNDYILQNGDLVTFDVGVTYQSYVCDAAYSIIVGGKNQNPKALKIYDATVDCLSKAIEQIKPGNYVGDIESAIYTTAKDHGYEVIKDFTGHGCGIKLHEDPIIRCFGIIKTGPILRPGMTLCIEPMLLTKSDQYYIDKKNHWTVIAKNHELTCHEEHMVLVTEDGCEILTA